MKLIILGFLALLAFVEATDYCSSTLCSGRKHIACGNSGKFSSSCPASARMVDMSAHKSAILKSHNDKRNRIAGGNLSGFSKAARMATMQWDDELASLAALNVKQCAMRHDECHNTDNFKYSGQNLAMYGYTGAENRVTDSTIISGRIDSWFNEYTNSNMNHINKYPASYSGPTIGHFTVMVADKNVRVGCAGSRWYDGTYNQFLFACNYATTNIINQSIYASSSSAGSGCTKGRNSNYPSLCALGETYPNLK